MAWKDCADAIRAAAGGLELDDEQVAAIFDEVEKRARSKRARSSLASVQEDIAAAAAEAGKEQQLRAMVEQRARYMDVLKKQGVDARLDEGGARKSRTLGAMNVGREGAETGIAKSVDAETQGIRSQLLGPMIQDLRRDGLLNVIRARTKAFERDVARELWRLTDPRQ